MQFNSLVFLPFFAAVLLVHNLRLSWTIRKVNLLLFGRSYRALRGSEYYQRQSLTTQVSLRNLSFFDRYQ